MATFCDLNMDCWLLQFNKFLNFHIRTVLFFLKKVYAFVCEDNIIITSSKFEYRQFKKDLHPYYMIIISTIDIYHT